MKGECLQYMARRKTQKEEAPKCPIRMMTDEEYAEFQMKEDIIQKKSAFMSKLHDASTTKRSVFSVKDVKRDKKKESSSEKNSPEFSFKQDGDGPAFSSLDVTGTGFMVGSELDDDDWEEMLHTFDTLSPIEDITDEERRRYRKRSEGDKYDDMFKKEHSMLNDVLADLQKRSKVINQRILSISPGKGPAGITKNFTELVEAGNSLDSTKLQVIKAIVDVKKTAVDLRMKDQKMNPTDDSEMDKDTIADRFYKSIISGNSQNFMQASNTQYGNQVSVPMAEKPDGMDDDEWEESRKFNFTNSNFTAQSFEDENYDTSTVDPHGYFESERRNASVIIERYSDGSMSFAAVTEDGEYIDSYDLPSEDLIETLNMKPMSNYAYDEYGRKYRVVDVETDGVSLDDIDDVKYNDLNNDDKYDI